MYLGKVCLSVSLLSFATSAEPESSWTSNMRLGRLLQSQGRLQEAHARFELALHEAERPPENADRQVTALSNLASVAIDMGRTEEAAQLCQRAISIVVKTAGEADARVQALRAELAGLFLNSGEVSAAENLLRKTIALEAKVSQAATPERAFALDVLACLYAKQQKMALAEKTERNSLAIWESNPGADKLWLAVANLHLSFFLTFRKKAAAALPYLERAMAIFKTLPEPRPSLEASAGMSLAYIYASLGRPSEAAQEGQRAVHLAEDFYGPTHPQTGWMLVAHAALLRRLHRKQEARVAQKRAEGILAEDRTRNHLEDTVPIDALLPH